MSLHIGGRGVRVCGGETAAQEEGGKASGTTWHSSLIAAVSVWDLEVTYCGIYWMESNQNEGSSLIVNA